MSLRTFRSFGVALTVVVISLAALNLARAQTEQPVYKIGEVMSNSIPCHDGIKQLIAIDPIWQGEQPVRGIYGCDLDPERSAKRAQELNRFIMQRRYERLEREENLRNQQPLK